MQRRNIFLSFIPSKNEKQDPVSLYLTAFTFERLQSSLQHSASCSSLWGKRTSFIILSFFQSGSVLHKNTVRQTGGRGDGQTDSSCGGNGEALVYLSRCKYPTVAAASQRALIVCSQSLRGDELSGEDAWRRTLTSASSPTLSCYCLLRKSNSQDSG